MLDQNSDRMWFVIGALVVGAGIILLANKAMPEVFAKIGESFSAVTNKSTNTIKNEFEPDNVIGADDLKPHGTYGKPQGVRLVDFDEGTDTWTLELPVSSVVYGRGLQVKKTAVRVPYGARFTTRYEVWVPEDINNARVTSDINNSFESKPLDSMLNDNDERDKRQFGVYENGKRVLVTTNPTEGIPTKAGEWTTVWYSYENTSPTNVNKEALYDYSYLGTTNPTDKPMIIKIRNVFGSLVNEDGEFINEDGEVIE